MLDKDILLLLKAVHELIRWTEASDEIKKELADRIYEFELGRTA